MDEDTYKIDLADGGTIINLSMEIPIRFVDYKHINKFDQAGVMLDCNTIISAHHETSSQVFVEFGDCTKIRTPLQVVVLPLPCKNISSFTRFGVMHMIMT
jgi:hypothetical protein